MFFSKKTHILMPLSTFKYQVYRISWYSPDRHWIDERLSRPGRHLVVLNSGLVNGRNKNISVIKCFSLQGVTKKIHLKLYSRICQNPLLPVSCSRDKTVGSKERRTISCFSFFCFI